MVSFAYAKVIERDDRRVYSEVCRGTDSACRSLTQEEYNDLIATEDVIFTWGYSNGTAYVDLRELFCKRHPFVISFAALGPFKSEVQSEQLREVVRHITQYGRVRWTTRAGDVRYWYDPKFYDIVNR